MSVGAVVPLVSGDVPPPLIEVFSAQEVKTAMVGLVVALAGAASALMLYLKAKFGRQQRDLSAVKDQTVNTHGPDGKNENMRDQLDRMEKNMTAGFRRIDHQFGEVHDRQQATDDRALEEHHRLWDAINRREN